MGPWRTPWAPRFRAGRAGRRAAGAAGGVEALLVREDGSVRTAGLAYAPEVDTQAQLAPC